jgi:hypothetical protein
MLPLDIDENRDAGSNNHETIVRYLMTSGTGVAEALTFCSEFTILQIPCLNHTMNRVFTHVAENVIMAARVNLLNDFIREL